MGSMIDITSESYNEKVLEDTWATVYAKRLFDEHTNNIDNPHSVTKAQVGLSDVDNVKQASKAEFDEFSQTAQEEMSNIRDEIPKKVSELENDSGFLTKHQNISHKANVTYVDSKVSEEVAARGIADSVFEERIKKIKYYGDADIEISPDEWFTFEDDGHTILTGFAEDHKNETSLVIPYSVTNIAMLAFEGCTGLTNVIIPKSVKIIGDSSFSGCTGLKSVEIPDSVTSIEFGAFSHCTNLEKIIIPSSVKYTNTGVLSNCSKVKVYCSQNFAALAMFEWGFKPESIVYLDMSINSKVTKDGENAVSGGAVYNALLTRSSSTLPQTLSVNTIYDLGEQTSLTLNLPSGQLGDFIEVDFLSTGTPTTLTITASSGISDYDLVPEENTIYSLYFNWIRLDASTYGWGFGYAEYTRTVA